METNFRSTVLRFCNTDLRKTPFFNDFTTKMCDSSTFLQHWYPKNTIFHRFHDIFVRQFYVFATLMTGKYCKTTNMKIAFSRSPCVLIGSKHENTRSPYVFIGFSNKDPVGTRDDIRQTHPNPWRPFRARVGQIYEIRRPFRARVVKIVEMNARQALTFLTVSRPKCATVLRFCNTDVRKTL